MAEQADDAAVYTWVSLEPLPDGETDAPTANYVKAAGKARIEGKEYVMRDGDVVEFRVGV